MMLRIYLFSQKLDYPLMRSEISAKHQKRSSLHYKVAAGRLCLALKKRELFNFFLWVFLFSCDQNNDKKLCAVKIT